MDGAVEHGLGVALAEGQHGHRARAAREPAGRVRRAGVPRVADRDVAGLGEHQDERGHGQPVPPPRERDAGQHVEGQHGQEREARQGAHAADEDEVLVEEAVEGGLRAERDEDRERRGDDGHRAVAPGRHGEAGQTEQQDGQAREERVLDALRIEVPLSDRAVEPRSSRRVRLEGGGVGGHVRHRPLHAVERPHAEVGTGHGQEEQRGESGAGGEAEQVPRFQPGEEGGADRGRQREGGDGPEVDGRQRLQREQQAHEQPAARRPLLPEAIQSEERERKEDRDLGV